MVVLTVELAVPAMKSRRTLFFGVAYDSRNGKGYRVLGRRIAAVARAL